MGPASEVQLVSACPAVGVCHLAVAEERNCPCVQLKDDTPLKHPVPNALCRLPVLQALPPSAGLRVVVSAAGRTLVTLLSVLLVPAALGAIRAALTGGAAMSQRAGNNPMYVYIILLYIITA